MNRGINSGRKRLWKLLPLTVSLIFAAAYAYCSGLRVEEGRAKISIPFGRVYDYNNILVAYVADGDTVKLENGLWVRLLGIDTPEYYDSDKLLRDARRRKQDISTIKEMGALSKAFTREILKNKRVRLEFDAEKYDKYDRLLAYVFLQDGTFVNAKIIEYGYARVMIIPPNLKYADLFIRLQQEAKAAKRGLWRMGY